jgi:hypothetical protein
MPMCVLMYTISMLNKLRSVHYPRWQLIYRLWIAGLPTIRKYGRVLLRGLGTNLFMKKTRGPIYRETVFLRNIIWN